MRVTLLAGGTGGTKLGHGFALLRPAPELTVIANVGDDAELHGLHVSPDIDALLYTLSGLIDTDQGWGVRDDTHTAQGMFERLGEPAWFSIGDADLALHAHRTRLMREGASLTAATAAMSAALGIGASILPATNDRYRTHLETDEGTIDFQDYFVRRRQQPKVRGVLRKGAEAARATTEVIDAIAGADRIVIGPSNPFVSIGPIVELAGIRDALATASAPKVAVSPIVAGRALKGPAARMLASLGHEVSALGVARLYAGLVGRFVIDVLDHELAPQIEALGMAVDVVPTVMSSDDDRASLAAALLR